MARNYLKGAIGDRINLLMAAAAWNLKQWLLVIFGSFSRGENCKFVGFLDEFKLQGMHFDRQPFSRVAFQNNNCCLILFQGRQLNIIISSKRSFEYTNSTKHLLF